LERSKYYAQNIEQQDEDSTLEPLPNKQLNPVGTTIVANDHFQKQPDERPFVQYVLDEATGELPEEALRTRTIRQPRWFFMNNRKILRQRRRPKFISTPPLHNLETTESMYSFMMLHLPHRQEPFDIIHTARITNDVVRAAFQTNKERVLLDGVSAADHYLGYLHRTVAELDELPSFLRDPVAPDGSLSGPPGLAETEPRAETTSIDHSAGMGQPPNDNLDNQSRSAYNDADRTDMYVSLSEQKALDVDQQRCVDLIQGYCRQVARKQSTIAPPHIFCTGSAGTGKSTLIKSVVEVVRNHTRNNPQVPRSHGGVIITASTGVAARQLSGETFFVAAGLRPQTRRAPGEDGMEDEDQSAIDLDTIGQERLTILRDKWKNVLLLILDECSMVSGELLYRLHLRLNLIMNRENDPSCYFGGIAILLVGDFYQLKPVRQPFMFMNSPRTPINLYKLLFHPVLLRTVHRQRDLDFIGLLQRIRTADHTTCDLNLLMSRHFSANTDV
jgi:hypothetical protein